MGDDVGRPTIMTPDIIKKLEGAFLLGCTDLEACLVADISKSTLYNYQNEHPEFVERKEALKKTPTYHARKTVADKVQTDADVAFKYLTHKERDEFSTKNELNTNLAFTQMPSITAGAQEGGKITKVKLEFKIGDKA